MNIVEALTAAKNGEIVFRDGSGKRYMLRQLDKPYSKQDNNVLIWTDPENPMPRTDFSFTLEDVEATDWMTEHQTSGVFVNHTAVQYLHVRAYVRFWEDGTVNGEEDDNEYPRMPLATDNGYWDITIDITNGKILDWKEGVEASTYYKVCDECSCELLSGNKSSLYYYTGYVPKILDFDDSDGHYGFGDYIGFEIDKSGYIKSWPTGEKLNYFIEDLLNKKSC